MNRVAGLMASSSFCQTKARWHLFKLAIPVLHASNITESAKFYCDSLGFKQEFAYRVDETLEDPCYMGLTRDGVEIHVSSFEKDSISGATVFLYVEDVDALYEELAAKGVRITLKPTNQSWGNREMYVSDPDGNCIRFVHESST